VFGSTDLRALQEYHPESEMKIGYKIVLSMVLTAFEEGPIIVAFLDRAGVLRQRTRGLLLQLFALSAVLFAAFYFYLFSCLGATDAGDVELEASNLSPDNLVISGVAGLAANLLHGDGHRWWLRLAHLLAGVSLGSLAYIITAFAAVALRSGEHHTMSSFVRKVQSNVLRPALTVAGACALRAAVTAAVVELIIPIRGPKYVIILTNMFFLVVVNGVLQAICAVAVVASVAEPGLCGKGAVARACRLMRGKYARGVYSRTSPMLRRAFWLLCTLVAMAGLPASGTVKCLLLVADEMISVANVTEYYFQCRNREEQEDKAGHRD
jgi:hypothetical protein